MIKQRLLISVGILALTALPITNSAVAQSVPTSNHVSETLKTLALTPRQKIEVYKIQEDAIFS
jgi:hypothetical protein